MAEPCLIEILDVSPHVRDNDVIVPNEIRINGHPVLAPEPVIVHEVRIDSSELVQVTLTLWARRVVIGHEQQEQP